MQFRRIVLFLGTLTALLFLTHQYGDFIIKAFMPLYEWMIHQIDYRLYKTHLFIANIHGENFLQLEVELSDPIWVGSQEIALTQPIFNSTGMALANVLQPIVLIFTIILVWPAKHAFDYGYRVLGAIPMIILIMMLDMPFQLVNNTWQGLEQTLKLNISNTNWFSYWSDFLNGGGLIAISITCGLLIVGLVNLIPNKLNVDSISVS
jgi:hypothetical protein